MNPLNWENRVQLTSLPPAADGGRTLPAHNPETSGNLREHAASAKPPRETSSGFHLRGHMGYVEISVEEGEDTKVVLHNNLRFLLTRLRVNDLQRHLVATWPNCSCGKRRLDDASFILVLKAFFLFCLSLALTATFYELYITTTVSPYPPIIEFDPFPYIGDQTWRDRVFNLTQPEIVFLGVFTAIFVISVLVRMKSRPSSQERRVEVKTISGEIQNL